MPRHRTARVAVLGSPVQRSATSSSTSARSSALRRRVVVGILVAASLVLLTVSFRSSTLDGVQGAGASALRPFEIAATRVAAPFRDATSWTRGLFRAKSENRTLAHEVEVLRSQNAKLLSAQAAIKWLDGLLHYEQSPTFPANFNSVAAQVVTSQSQFDQAVIITAGTNSGIRVHDVVVTNEGLVGTVTKVTGSESRVTLITSDSSGVTSLDVREQSAIGVLQTESSGDTLDLNNIGKNQVVRVGDTIVTAGSQVGQLPSLFPADIPIGTVTYVGQNETDIYKQIEVQPFVNLSSLHAVIVLLPKPKSATTQTKKR